MMLDWAGVIEKHIQASQGFKRKLPAPEMSEFWRFDQITAEQFIEQADTFDIVLFRCNTAGGKVVRGYTGSEFGK
jgi:hypothetical protein